MRISNLIALALALVTTLGACSWEAPKCASGDCATEDTDRPSDGTDGRDGAQGPAGISFDAAQLRSVSDPTAAAACPNGGSAIRFTYGGVAIAGDPLVACNGATGAQGIPGNAVGAQAITMISASVLEGGYCGNADGTSITFYQGGLQLGSTIWTCNGSDGERGLQGERGIQGDRGYTGATGSPGRDGTCPTDCATPAPAILEICDSLDNDHNDGVEVGGVADGIDESIGPVYSLFITSSIEPSEPASRRQLCIWDSATNPQDPDTVEDWIGCAQSGTWNTQGNTSIERWELGDLFPIQTVMQNFDCEAVRQGVPAGGTLTINLATPGDGVTCDSFRIVYRNFDGTPSTPVCSL